VLFLSLLANSRVERCRTDDLMPNVPISCLPESRVDPEVPIAQRSAFELIQLEKYDVHRVRNTVVST